MERTTITLPRDLMRRLRYEAARAGDTVSGMVRDAVQEYIAHQPENPMPEFVGKYSSERRDFSTATKDLVAEAVEERYRDDVRSFRAD